MSEYLEAEQIRDRTAYWEEQLKIANKFKEVAEKELARLAILQEGLW